MLVCENARDATRYLVRILSWRLPWDIAPLLDARSRVCFIKTYLNGAISFFPLDNALSRACSKSAVMRTSYGAIETSDASIRSYVRDRAAFIPCDIFRAARTSLLR